MSMENTAHAVYSPDDGGWYVEVFNKDGARWTTGLHESASEAKSDARANSPHQPLFWLRDINLS